jgi:hypothetical protein
MTLAAAAALLAPGCGARVDGVTSDAGTDAPQPQPSGCPSSEPANGASCSSEITCNYGNCYGTPTTTAMCRNGEWQVIEATCNPPPPECPRTEPDPSAPCSFFGSGCTYPDRCLPGATKKYTCSGAKWLVEISTVIAACPTTPPLDGASCADCAGRYPDTCVYEYCGSYPSREAICNPVTKTWSSRWSSCNPPPPWDSGPGPEDPDAWPPPSDPDTP